MMAAQPKGTPPEEEGGLRRMFPQLSDSEFAALKSLDPLVREIETDPQFRRELATALLQRGAITVRVECRSKVVVRALKKMELGAPESNASACRAVQNITIHLLNAAVEQANGKE